MPLVVIVPPVRPVPAVIEVTVPEPPPPPPVAVIVVVPKKVDSAMPGPAARTFPTSFISSGTVAPVVMPMPAEIATGK